MLQSAKGRYLEKYLWEAVVDWRQLFPLGPYDHNSIIWQTISNILAIVRESLISQVLSEMEEWRKILILQCYIPVQTIEQFLCGDNL